MTSPRRISGADRETEKSPTAPDYTTIASLERADPRHRKRPGRGVAVDRCRPHICRCAVYFHRSGRPEPEKRKQWDWKDGAQKEIAAFRRKRKAAFTDA